jgi:hypothetical protein
MTPERITIDGKAYFAQRLEVDPRTGCRALVRFVRIDTGSISDVSIQANGLEDCSCGDFVFRSGPVGKRCKHIRTAAEMGWLDQPIEPECDPNEPADLQEIDR